MLRLLSWRQWHPAYAQYPACRSILSVASENRPVFSRSRPIRQLRIAARGFVFRNRLMTSNISVMRPCFLHHFAELARQHRDGEVLRINSLLDSPLLKLIHDVGDADLAGAFHRAGVTGCAQPNGMAPEHLVLEIAARQRHDLAGRVIHVNAQRAYPRAGAALDAALQLLAPRHAASPPCRSL